MSNSKRVLVLLSTYNGECYLEEQLDSILNQEQVSPTILIRDDGSVDSTNHYKFNGTSWSKVSTLPYNFYDGCSVALDGEIHILGSLYTILSEDHYKWNGTNGSFLP